MAIEWNNTIQTIGNLVTVSFSNELGSDKIRRRPSQNANFGKKAMDSFLTHSNMML